MIEIEKKISCVSEPLDSKKPSLILVHPFYNRFCSRFNHPFSEKPSNYGLTYAGNLADLIVANKENNILLLDETKNLDFSLYYITQLSGEKGRYFMHANEHGPNKDILIEQEDYDSLASFLKTISTEFSFAGGRLAILFPGSERIKKMFPQKTTKIDQKESFFPDTFCGCLGDVYRNLERREIKGKILEDACYK